jgi:hypothetical protein
VAGWLALAHVVLLFVGVALMYSVELGDKPSAVVQALVGSAMTKSYAGGAIQFVGFLVFLVFALLVARLVQGDDEVSGWLASCVSAAAVVYVAVTIATGFAAGAAALYNGHHGAPLATITTVNDIRNFGFFLSVGVQGLFTLAVAAAARTTDALPRWVSATGVVVGLACIVGVPAARLHVTDVGTMIWFLWFVGFAVAALRHGGRTSRPLGAAPHSAVPV